MPTKTEVLLSMASSNVEVIKLEDGRYAVAFDPKKRELGLSTSGKSMKVASTRGSININGISIGFNAYVKN